MAFTVSLNPTWDSRPEPVPETVLAVSVLIQGLWLAWVALPEVFFAALLALSSLLIMGGFHLAWRRRRRFFALDTLLVTAGPGGLGMLVGMSVDASLGEHLHGGLMMHQHGMSLGSMVWSWTTGCMLLFCLPACFWFCDRPCRLESRGAHVTFHLVLCGSMLAGMLFAGVWLTPVLAGHLELGIVGSHLCMVLGMVGGSWLGLQGLRRGFSID